jgi:hypothetical protein
MEEAPQKHINVKPPSRGHFTTDVHQVDDLPLVHPHNHIGHVKQGGGAGELGIVFDKF